jgi:hypothetical protein
METAFILTKQGGKLFNLKCQIKESIKAKIVAGDVFVVSATAGVRDAASLAVVPVTVESPSRFVSLEIYRPGEAKLSATISGSSILSLAEMDWDGLAYCTDLPLLADAQAAHTSETTSTNKVRLRSSYNIYLT